MNFNTLETRAISNAYDKILHPVVESQVTPPTDEPDEQPAESSEPTEPTSETPEVSEGFGSDKAVAIELFDFINNDHPLFDMYEKSYVPTLLRKIKRKVYQSDLAPKLFVHLATIGAKKYGKDLMDGESNGLEAFTPAIRLETAKLLTDMFEDENADAIDKMKSGKTESEHGDAFDRMQQRYDNAEPKDTDGEDGEDGDDDEDAKELRYTAKLVKELLEFLYDLNEKSGWILIPSRMGKDYDDGKNWTKEELDSLTKLVNGEWISESSEDSDVPLKTPDEVFAALRKVNHDVLHHPIAVKGDWVPDFTDIVSSIATFVKRGEFDKQKEKFEKRVENLKRQIKEGYYTDVEVEFLREYIARLNLAIRGYTEKVGAQKECADTTEGVAVEEADKTPEADDEDATPEEPTDDTGSDREAKITAYEADMTPEDLLFNFIKKDKQLSEDELYIFHANLKLKIDRMEYDPDLAVGQFMYLVGRGVNKYGKEIYDDVKRAKEKFDTKVQQNVAKRLTLAFEEPYAKEIAEIQAKRG